MKERIEEALEILRVLGMPRGQLNERSALTLLALLNITPDKPWNAAEPPMIGITPVMDWVKQHYDRQYAPNTRETFRRQTMHQFEDAGIVSYNPDKPDRPVNSPKAVYQITPETLELLRSYATPAWDENLRRYREVQQSLADKYAAHRKLQLVPIRIEEGKTIELSPGAHSELIRKIIEEFAPRFAPGSLPVYVGDTGDKFGYFNIALLRELGVEVDTHGKMPDVVLHYVERNWVLLVESVTSHGPMDSKRHEELEELFGEAHAGLVYVTAFPDRHVMAKYLPDISWQTEVWCADAPSHLIHFNGIRFLGPYEE